MKTKFLIIIVMTILFTVAAVFTVDNYLIQLHNEDIFKQIMVDCSNGAVNPSVNSSDNPDKLRFMNDTHFIDNVYCEWVPNDTYANILPETETNNSPKLISKSLATFYAAEQRGLSEEDFKKYDSHATLLKIKNNGFVFEVDPNTLEERDLYMNRFNEYPDGQYIWLVSLVKNKEYQYHINATDGKILLSAQDGTVLTGPYGIENEE